MLLNLHSRAPLAFLCRVGGWIASCHEEVLRLLFPVWYRVKYFSWLEAFDGCGAFSHSWFLRSDVL